MLDEHPTAVELLAAVREYLAGDLIRKSDRSERYNLRMAIAAIAIVERELSMDEPTPTLLDPVGRRSVADALRDGSADPADPALLERLRADAVARLAVSNPAYPSLARASRPAAGESR